MQLVAIGSITVDIVVSGMPAELARGDKQEVGSIDLYPGGGALNATASFMEQGESVRLLGALGQDGLGDRLRAHIGQLGIDVSSVQTCPDQPTGKAIVLVEPSGSASVLARRGANACLHVHAQDLHADLIYVAPLALQPMESLAQALADRDASSSCLVVNPSVACLRHQGQGFKQVYALADVLGLNVVEAQMLAGVQDADIQLELSIQEACELAARLQHHPQQALLITLGVQGAVLAFNGQQYAEPACKVAVCSTVGAGDAFLSSFALAWKRGLEPSDALKLASQAAAARLGQWAANTFPPMFGQDAAEVLTL
ncbi:carbohydrate kinase family protein [Alcaligenes faecalis]|uniref:carbohydrate kinase family protein n=1 Tax=Alcaligenes faecalis TaxID=511 RepID=UPI0024BC116F|nr:PfkB family carbohydrate kinase [Alcaligenes faecalis]WHQ44145.1 carbohydrate kinase family protein [Alcaligenes faecalis]